MKNEKIYHDRAEPAISCNHDDLHEISEHQRELQDLAKFPSENPHPVMRIDKDGVILYANAAAEPLLDAQADVVGKTAPVEWIHRGAEAFRVGQPQIFEVIHDGTILLFSLVPVIDAGYVNWYGRDITEQKRAMQAELDVRKQLLDEHRCARERAEAEINRLRDTLVRTTRLAAIGQVSATIAHDLRNPLGTIRNAVFYLNRKATGDQPILREYLDIINQEVETANAIITNLMAMARSEMTIKQEVDLAKLVFDVMARNQKDDKLRFKFSVDPDPFMVYADPNQLRQVMQNLIENASAAMVGQGDIFMDARRDDEYDTIILGDSGPGVAAKVRETLFEPLVTTKVKGIGLGLTICRLIIERHGGTIELVDRNEGGAAFCIRLSRMHKTETS